MNNITISFHNLLKLVLFIFITFINFWWLPIFRDNLWYGLLLVMLTFFLFTTSATNLFVVSSKSFAIPRLLIIVFGLLFIILSVLLIKDHFDNTIEIVSPTEKKIQLQRHGLYANGLEILFTNRFSQNFYINWSLPIAKYLRNISYSIDPNLYFFSSHPREKSGIDEFEKYSPFLLPLFVIGLLIHTLSLSKYKFLTIYLLASIFVTGFLSPYFKLGPILLFPYINIVTALAIIAVLKRIYAKKTH